MADEMFAILHIHADGGVSSCTGRTSQEAAEKARKKLAYFARSCMVATIPYPCRRAGNGWDSTLPEQIRAALGEEIVRLAGREG